MHGMRVFDPTSDRYMYGRVLAVLGETTLGHMSTPRWMRMACELGGVIGRSSRPTCFILGAGCSLSSGAPPTSVVDQAFRDATSARFEGLELRDALHTIPEHEKQDILAPLFADVRPARGYLALAALGRHRLVTVINLNWDTALTQACQQVGVRHEVRDSKQLTRRRPSSFATGVINIHAHGMIGHECRYGRLETLNFNRTETAWLLEHGFANTTVIIGASLQGETNFTMVFGEWAKSAGGRRPTASQWFFSREATEEGDDRLRRANTHAQPMTYVRDPDVDFDTIAMLVTDRAVGTILSASPKATR